MYKLQDFNKHTKNIDIIDDSWCYVVLVTEYFLLFGVFYALFHTALIRPQMNKIIFEY